MSGACKTRVLIIAKSGEVERRAKPTDGYLSFNSSKAFSMSPLCIKFWIISRSWIAEVGC